MIVNTLQIPAVEAPGYSYAHGVRHGSLIITSGIIPKFGGQLRTFGRLGQDVTLSEAVSAARRCALLGLSIAVDLAGGRDNVLGVLQSNCYVSCTDDFEEISEVAEGAREVLMGAFAEPQVYSRSTMGVRRLPVNSPVMFDFLFHTAE